METVVGFIIGFILGIIVVALAIELGMRKTHNEQPTSRPTHTWSVDEIENPRIIAESLGAIKLPSDARVVVNRCQDKNMLKGLQVKEHPGIRGNYIVGDDRALIISGSLTPNALGVWTVEKNMLDKLHGYFEDSWCKASTMEFDESDL